MKIKTSELRGPALDWAVAKANGIEGFVFSDGSTGKVVLKNYSPSTNWVRGGPIIECEGIFVRPIRSLGGWRCWIYDGKGEGKGEGIKFDQHGPTPLIAAMRVYVASKLGNEIEIEIEIPEEGE